MLALDRASQPGSKPDDGDVGHVEKRQRVRTQPDWKITGQGTLTGADRHRHNGLHGRGSSRDAMNVPTGTIPVLLNEPLARFCYATRSS